MDLGTGYCCPGVLLPLLTRSLTQGVWRMLGRYSSFEYVLACLLARCLLNEGARESSSRQATTPARYEEGTLVTNQNAGKGERGYHNIQNKSVTNATHKNRVNSDPDTEIKSTSATHTKTKHISVHTLKPSDFRFA